MLPRAGMSIACDEDGDDDSYSYSSLLCLPKLKSWRNTNFLKRSLQLAMFVSSMADHLSFLRASSLIFIVLYCIVLYCIVFQGTYVSRIIYCCDNKQWFMKIERVLMDILF